MKTKTAPFLLNRSGMMLALVSAAFAGEAGAVAGRTEFTIGGVTVTRDGVARPLTRGAELDAGDTVRTNDGRAQIRYTDGAYVSLQPNTEYAIREYRYDASKTDGNETGFFGLVRGAMRTVTGAIGRVNRGRYQITTPTATVGIRGTGGVIQVLDNGATLVIGTSGIWSLTNPAGSIDVPAGVSGLSPTDPDQPPQETTTQPTSGPAELPKEEPQYVQGEERTATGDPVIVQAFTPLQTGTGYAAVLIFTDAQSFPRQSGGDFAGFQSADAVFDGQGRLTSISDPGVGFYRASLDPASGVHSEFGSDGMLAWGRWTGTVHVIGNSSPDFSKVYGNNEGFHYVVGMPTAIMPASGSASYSLLGATSPTYADGRSAPGTFSGSLNVTFGVSATVGGNFSVAMPDGKGWQWSTSTSARSPFFSMSASDPAFTGIGGACATSPSVCSAGIQGFFAGTNAERAGINYHIRDTSNGPGGSDVIGAAAFKKN